MKALIWGGMCLAFGCLRLSAAQTSANYTLTPEALDGGGARTSSANYVNDGSAGLIVGTSNVSAAQEAFLQGYVAQLYEVTALQLSATTNAVNERQTLQVNAAQVLDDGSQILLASNIVSWSIVSGPLTSVSTSGLVTAGTVYQNTPAAVSGSYAGQSGALALTVVNVNIDDYQSYANDGIDDAWQVKYFGINNPLAGPTQDVDGTGQNNLFKYIAELNPLDPTSRFIVQVQLVTGQSSQKNVLFGPTFTDRTYTLQASTDLVNWTTIAGPSPGNQGTVTILDTNAGPPAKFYRVQITGP